MEFKEKIISLTSLSIYGIINAMIYQWSFWGMFSINIMEFISINDLLPSVAFSVSFPMIIFLIYIYILEKISKKEGNKSSHLIKTVTISKKEKKPKKINKNLIFIFMMLSLITYLDPKFSLKFTSLMVASFIIFKTLNMTPNLLQELGLFRKPVVVIVACTPPLMFIAGVVNAYLTLQDKNPIIVETNSSCFNSKDIYIYIGTVSDKAFALSQKDRSVCIFKYEYLKLQKMENMQRSEINPIVAHRT